MNPFSSKERIFNINKMKYFQTVLLKPRKNLDFMWDKTWIAIRIKIFLISDIVIWNPTDEKRDVFN